MKRYKIKYINNLKKSPFVVYLPNIKMLIMNLKKL